MLRRNRRRGVATAVVAGAAIGAARAQPPAAATAPVQAAANTGANRYRMVEKLVSIGDDFFIQNDRGQRVFKVNGKALRVRDTLFIEDMQGRQLCKIQTRVARLRDSMEIEGPDGHRLALVHKAMITPLRDRFAVKIGDGPDLEVQGNILDQSTGSERGDGLPQVVPHSGFVRGGSRPRPKRRPDPGDYRRCRPDDARRRLIPV